jgi:hypothetical protein
MATYHAIAATSQALLGLLREPAQNEFANADFLLYRPLISTHG